MGITSGLRQKREQETDPSTELLPWARKVEMKVDGSLGGEAEVTTVSSLWMGSCVSFSCYLSPKQRP